MGKPYPVSLLGAPYDSKSVTADLQRCINLFPEAAVNQQAPAPLTHYLTPGLRPLAQTPIGAPMRCEYRTTNGDLYVVSGKKVYFVNLNFTFVEIGTIADLLTPVYMADNGLVICLVDGTTSGYSIDVTTHVMTPIVDPAFYGSTSVDYIDGFFIFNQPGTRNFYISLNGSLTFDPLDIVAKTGSSDPVQRIICIRREAWVIGTLTTEVWYNSGAADFALAPIPGAFLQHGTNAPYSVATIDGTVFWLDQDKTGTGTVSMSLYYHAKRISTFAIESEMQNYSTLNDAIGYCYQQDGHAFYVLTFPTADKTWVYELSTGFWHMRSTIDGNGVLHRHRGNCFAFAYNNIIIGDYQNGFLYAFDTEFYTDNGVSIPRIRTMPHIIVSGMEVEYQRFEVDIEPGELSSDSTDSHLMSLVWSDTKGKTWGNPVTQTMGAAGEYLTQPIWNNLGQARDRVFEISWSTPGKTSLNNVNILAIPIE